MGFGSWLKDKVDDAGDAIEGAVDSGEKLLGEGVEKVSHAAETGLDDLGAHGAADWVRSHGDSLADHLGADVEEMQLGQTDDPKQLVHGDVDKLHDDASHLTDLAKSFGEVADGLARIDAGDWQGQGGDAFDAVKAKTPTDWRHAEDACTKASTALTSYASTLKWAQDQAADAIRQYNDAKAKQQQAEDDYNAKVDSYNKAVDAHNAGGTAALPDKPGDFHDPGPALFQAAQDTLDTARKQRDDAANDAASAIEGATATAPAKPDFTDRMVADGTDAFNMYNYQGAHFVGGIMKGSGELIKFARSMNPTDPYNLSHPNEFVASQNQLAAGLLDTAVHPGQLVHSVIGSGWTTDPAEALGKLVPQVALTVATDGAGAGAGVAERGMIGVGEDVAERGGLEVGESAAERGAVDVGEDASTLGDDAGNVADNAEHDPGETAQNGHGDDSKCPGGEPVDLATGAFFTLHTDLHLPGVVPLTVTRKQSSDWHYGLWFGPTWASTFDERIDVNPDHVVIISADATAVVYPHPSAEAPSSPYLGGAAQLRMTEVGGYELTDPATGEVKHYLRPYKGRSYLAATTDPTGHRVSILRDAYGVPVEIRHTGGYRVLVHSVGLRVRGLSVVNDDGTDPVSVAGYEYDDSGNLVGVLNASGEPLRYSYDDAGRLVEWVDRNGTTYWNRYDDEGRCIDQAGTGGVMAWRFAYNKISDELRETLVTDSKGNTSRYLVNSRSQIISETDPLGHETRTTWDDRNHILSHTDARGGVTRFTYDADGNLTSITRADGTQQHLEWTTAGGHPCPTRIVMPDGAIWTYEYDERGLRTKVIDPAGAPTTYVYSVEGHLETVTDALGATRTIETNPVGLPIRITEADGNAVTLERDALGRVTSIMDALGARTELAWTPDGQLASRTYPDGSVETWRYDGEGNAIEHTDAAGRTERTTWTHFDLPSEVTAVDGTQTRYTYDPELNLVAVTNAAGATWTYTRDPAGRVVSETDFNGRTITYQYDPTGRLIKRVNGAGEESRYERDLLGNVTAQHIQQPDGTMATTTFAYDAMGRLLRAVGRDVDLVLERDVRGQVVAEIVNDRRIGSSYDAAGRKTERTTPSGVRSEWAYGATGAPEAVVIAGNRIAFDRDVVGQEIRRTIGSSVHVDQTWDVLGHLTNQTVVTEPTAAGNTLEDRLGGLAGSPREEARLLQHRRYTYAPGGQLIGTDDHLSGARRFELDLANRITSVSGPIPERFAYDQLGNVTRASCDDQDAERRSYAGTLLLRSGRDRYRYDAQGRLTTKIRTQISRKPQVWSYSWDAEDRLVEVRTPDGARWSYLYDALGRRVAKQKHDEAGDVVEETRFAWDGTTLVEEASPDGTRAWEYAGTRPLAQIELTQEQVDAQFYAIVTDLIGTPSELITVDGDLAWHARRSLWGASLSPQSEVTPLRFPGQYADAETGLHYNHQRYYDPATARYLSQDPLGLAPAPNPNTYVHNPTTWVDPLGLEGCGETPREENPASPTYRELRNEGAKDAHHIIQDAAVRDVPGYARGDAPAIQLDGPSTQAGTEHYNATQVQRLPGGGTYGAERQIAADALNAAGKSPEEIQAALKRCDAYFMDKLGLTHDSPLRIPGNRPR